MAAWDEREIAQVLAWLGKGLSAGQIAAAATREFGRGEVTRNAVIGKVTRDKRLAAIGFRGGPGKRATRAASAAKTVRPAKAAAIAAGSRIAAPVVPRRARPETDSIALPEIAPAPHWQSPPGRAAPMEFREAADAGRCLFFAGEVLGPDGPEAPVCGAPRDEAAGPLNRYCPACRHRSWQAGSPARRAA